MAAAPQWKAEDVAYEERIQAVLLRMVDFKEQVELGLPEVAHHLRHQRVHRLQVALGHAGV